MSNRLGILGSFIVGTLVGIIATRTYYKKKIDEIYEQKDAEIKSIHDEYREQVKESVKGILDGKDQKASKRSEKMFEKPDLDSYVKKIEKEEYSKKKDPKPKIYKITEEQFAFDEDEDGNGVPYDKISLYYYEDGVLADDTKTEMDNAEEVIGNYEEDEDFKAGETIYIRNEVLGIDYEILHEEGTYDEEAASRPVRVSL